MIQARHTYNGKLVCELFSRYKLKRAFKSIRIKGNHADSGMPVLMIANHFSWWDGFIQYRLNTQTYKRKFHVMMLEEQLCDHMILNKGGAFSIRKQSRDIIRSLQYCTGLLTHRDNLVLIFPQGKIESIYTPYLHFESGLSYLLKHISNDIQLVFNVNLIDYFSDSKPSLTIYHQTYDAPSPFDLKQIEEDFNNYYCQCKSSQGEL